MLHRQCRSATKAAVSVLAAAAVALGGYGTASLAADDAARHYAQQELESVIDGIIRWKAQAVGAVSEDRLVDSTLSALAGQSAADWYAIGIARRPGASACPAYLQGLYDASAALYSEGKQDSVPATDLHRIILAIDALGGDPRAVARKGGSGTLDLVADFTYDRGRAAPLDRQGITGPIWALIALDAQKTEIPEGSFSTRDDLIDMILEARRADGGFALTGSAADPDLTAMAIQALSPYYGDPKTYGLTDETDGSKSGVTVGDAIDAALERLSVLQKDTGDYSSWGNRNSQTGAQVLIALCSLGIDPQSDERFIKHGTTLIDGIMLYRMPDLGFANLYRDPDSGQAMKSDSKAGEQVLCALVAMIRGMRGMRGLYDMRPEEAATPAAEISGTGSGIVSRTGSGTGGGRNRTALLWAASACAAAAIAAGIASAASASRRRRDKAGRAS